MILPATGRGTVPRKRNGGGGSSLRKPSVDRARSLRRRMTLPEVLLWQQLRAKKLGFKVLRQHPIGPYVVDFYISEARLIIEVDGEVHNRADNPDRDQKRDGHLAAQGHFIMRIAAADVLNCMEGALEEIVARLENPLHHPSDGPPPRPGEEL